MNIRRFGPGHRRTDRAAGSRGVLSSPIFSNEAAQSTEFTVTPGGTYGPLSSAGDVVLVVIDQAKLPPNINYGGLIAAPIFAEIAKKISELPNR